MEGSHTKIASAIFELLFAGEFTVSAYELFFACPCLLFTSLILFSYFNCVELAGVFLRGKLMVSARHVTTMLLFSLFHLT